MSGPDKQITIRLRAHEKSLIDRALKRSGISLQAWARALLVEVAEDELIDPASRSRVHRMTLANALMARHMIEQLFVQHGNEADAKRIERQVRRYVEELCHLDQRAGV
jgi:hypothetical protein